MKKEYIIRKNGVLIMGNDSFLVIFIRHDAGTNVQCRQTCAQ